MLREPKIVSREIRIAPLDLPGDLAAPAEPKGLVVFAHGGGSSRLSPRNRAVADGLNRAGFATLLFDLLKAEEERDRSNVFNIDLLAERLNWAIEWIGRDPELAKLPLGLFGASTGAAAALKAAARLGDRIALLDVGGRLAQYDTPERILAAPAEPFTPSRSPTA